MDLGSVAEWIAALAGAAAVVAAVFAGLYAKRAFDLERKREDRAEHSRRRDQASRIAAWPSYRVADKTYGVTIANTSDSLVYDVTVTVTTPHTEAGVVLRFLPPGTYFAAEPWRRATFPECVASTADYRPVMSTDKYTVEVAFADAKGVDWRRPHGRPLQDVSTA